MGEGLPLILLHQAMMASGQFDWVYAPLAKRGIRAIGIDMPGFGMSDMTPMVPRVEDLACCVPPVLDALGLTSAAILGHHTGAMIATEAAIQFPHRISALIMNGPMPVTEAERQDFLNNGYPREKANVAVSGGKHFNVVFAGRERLAAGTVPLDRISNYVVQAFVGQAPYWYGHHAAFQYHHELSLPKIPCCAMILTNTGDIIYENAKRAKAIRPDIPLVALDGGGVDIVDQQPEQWADAVAHFLKIPR
nr:alpha/beta hydrolase [Sphingomonas vulcanisoli]